MNPGDMYHTSGHVRMHDMYASGGTGVCVYESALSNGGRVWWTFYSWSSLDSYQWCIGNFNCW